MCSDHAQPPPRVTIEDLLPHFYFMVKLKYKCEGMKKTKKVKFPSELRFDLISKDWVVIATGRAKKPNDFKKEKRVIPIVPKKSCPFCNINTQEKPTLIFSRGKRFSFKDWKALPKDWTIIVIPKIGRAHV